MYNPSCLYTEAHLSNVLWYQTKQGPQTWTLCQYQTCVYMQITSRLTHNKLSTLEMSTRRLQVTSERHIFALVTQHCMY